jgi:endonuclease/exonuclease/phosphatase family metal-dependent hydrolase
VPALGYAACECAAAGVCVWRSGFHDLSIERGQRVHECLFTEPTESTVGEQPALNGVVPSLRLDYILGNARLLDRASNVSCTVLSSNVTGLLSDHYPVTCAWKV